MAAALLIALGACRAAPLFTVYTDPATGYRVIYNSGYHRGVWSQLDGDRGEAGDVNPIVLEYIFAAPESPFARYYDLVLSLVDRPRAVTADLAGLDAEARRGLPPGALPRGCDYARALGRKLSDPIREALCKKDLSTVYEGTAGVQWGIPVDLDAGIPLLDYESAPVAETRTTLVRYQSMGLLVMHSSATQRMLVWDVGEVPGAFDGGAPLDLSIVEARSVALHPPGP